MCFFSIYLMVLEKHIGKMILYDNIDTMWENIMFSFIPKSFPGDYIGCSASKEWPETLHLIYTFLFLLFFFTFFLPFNFFTTDKMTKNNPNYFYRNNVYS